MRDKIYLDGERVILTSNFDVSESRVEEIKKAARPYDVCVENIGRLALRN